MIEKKIALEQQTASSPKLSRREFLIWLLGTIGGGIFSVYERESKHSFRSKLDMVYSTTGSILGGSFGYGLGFITKSTLRRFILTPGCAYIGEDFMSTKRNTVTLAQAENQANSSKDLDNDL